MTKADIVSEIAKSTGVEKVQVQAIVEAFMDSIKTSLTNKNNVYLRGMPDAGGRGRAAAPASGRVLAVPGLFGRNDARKRLLPFRRVCG